MKRKKGYIKQYGKNDWRWLMWYEGSYVYCDWSGTIKTKRECIKSFLEKYPDTDYTVSQLSKIIKKEIGKNGKNKV